MAQSAADRSGVTPAAPLFRPAMTSGGGNTNVAAMEDDQLYSIIMGMDPPPPVTVPAGAGERNPPVSLEDTKKAIQLAKASIGAKSTSKSDQTDGGSNSEDEDFSPKGGSGKNKRVMANRQSAQRSRLRKLQYIQDLENNVARLQNEICQIQPQLNFLQEKYAGLSSQNHKLRDKVASLLNEARYKDSMNNSLREEIARIVTKTGEANPLNLGGQEGHEGFGAQPAAPAHFNAAM